MLVLFTSVRVAVGYLIVPNMSTRQQAPFIHPFIRFVSRFGLAVNKVLRLVSGGGRAVGWGVGGWGWNAKASGFGAMFTATHLYRSKYSVGRH